MGKSKDLATGSSTLYQTQTTSDTRYVNTAGDTMTGTLNITGDLSVSTATNAKLSVNDQIGEVGDGNLAFQAQNTAGSALKPMGFRAEDIRFATGSSERMRIDASGRVTKPNQPAASWGTSTDRTLPQNSSWQDVQLNVENYDRGNNYNTSNYRFTAPVAGVYLVGFSGEFQCTSATVWTYLCPRINGSNTANLNSKGNYFADFTTPVATYYQHSQTWLLNLAANDYFVFSANGAGGTLKIKSNTELQFFATLLG
jgi:hypothetical protein